MSDIKTNRYTITVNNQNLLFASCDTSEYKDFEFYDEAIEWYNKYIEQNCRLDGCDPKARPVHVKLLKNGRIIQNTNTWV